MINEVRWGAEQPPDFERIRRGLLDEGYVVVRNMISPKEIARIRAIVEAHLKVHGARYQLGKTQPNAAAEVPELDFIFRHPRVLEVFREIFGAGATVFTRHCDIHRNMVSGWHKDSGETVKGGYFEGDYFAANDCLVYKIAFYLQGSTAKSGLTVEPGSHRVSHIHSGEKLKVLTRIGDAIIFDVRLSHTGQLPDVPERALQAISAAFNRGHRKKQDPRLVTTLHEIYWRARGWEDRMSIFFTFGKDNKFTHDFASANLARQVRQLEADQGADLEGIGQLAADLARSGVLTHGVNAGGTISQALR